MNLWVLCCIFGQCFSSSTFFPLRYPEPSSKIVFCLKVYHISDPCPTSVRYQISSNVVLWQNLHCPLSFLQTSELLVFFIFPAQHKKTHAPITSSFCFIFSQTYVYTVLALTLIIINEYVNSNMRSIKYLRNVIF